MDNTELDRPKKKRKHSSSKKHEKEKTKEHKRHREKSRKHHKKKSEESIHQKEQSHTCPSVELPSQLPNVEGISSNVVF